MPIELVFLLLKYTFFKVYIKNFKKYDITEYTSFKKRKDNLDIRVCHH